MTWLRSVLLLPLLFGGSSLMSGCMHFHKGPMPGEPAGAYAELLGTRVRYVDHGQGPAVVFLHGFASAIEAWAPVMPAFSKDHRVIALDLKGFGWTDRPPGDYSPPAQAALVLALLDKLGVQQADVVAHSWGASVALQLTLDAPERVRRLALYDAWAYEEQIPTFFLWARAPSVGEALFNTWYDQRPADRLVLAFHDPAIVTEALIEDVEAALRRPGTKAAALAAVRGQRYAEVQKRYRTITKPTLLLWGEDDRVTPVSVAERLVSELPAAKLIRYPRCGHFPMIEASAASTAALRTFLTEQPR